MEFLLSSFDVSKIIYVFSRVSGILTFFIGFREGWVPVRIQISIVFLIVIFLSLNSVVGIKGDFGEFRFDFVLIEILNGVVIGLLIRLIYSSLHVVGTIISQSISLSQLLGGATAEPLPAIGTTLTLAACAIVAHVGLAALLLDVILGSYRLAGVGEFILSGSLSEFFKYVLDDIFHFVFVLASAFLAVSLLYYLLLGAVNRAMPQLMVAFVGAPAIVGLGIFLFGLALPFIVEIWMGYLAEVIQNIGALQ